MRVAVGSKNPVKITAVKEGFSTVWPDVVWDVEGHDVGSEVSDQPMSDTESIIGAKNRARKASELLKADFGVGLEGGLQQIGEKWFDSGWIVIRDAKGIEGIGSTIKMETPPKMMELIQKGHELGIVDDMLFNQTNSKQKTGHFGLMTNGILSRSDMYKNAVITALARFLHPELF